MAKTPPIAGLAERGGAAKRVRPSRRPTLETPDPPFHDYVHLALDLTLVRVARYAGKL